MNRTRSFLWFLALLFLLASCGPQSSPEVGAQEESPATITAASPVASPEGPSPVATEGESPAQVTASSLVEARVRERGGYDQTVEIELREQTSVVTLPGLSLYVATPLVPDEGSAHCAVYGEEAWCSEEALPNIVRRFALGSDPEQLGDDEWLALVAFFSRTEPLAGANDLELIDSTIPDEDRARIEAPVVDRLESGETAITYFYETVSYDAYPDGPMALRRMDVVIRQDNTMTLEYTDVWSSPGPED